MGRIGTDYNRIVLVNNKADLPTASAGVITLAANTMYEFVNDINLVNDRLVCSQDTFIRGLNSEVASITSSLTSQALISSAFTTPIESISLSVSGTGATILNFDATANAGQAIDWENVNFLGGSIGTIKAYSNVILAECAILGGTGGFIFDGTIGTIAFSDTLFSGFTGGTYITLPATANITRRFRVVYSSFVATAGITAIDVNASATIGAEGYILDTVNFSGGGTYLSGVTQTSDKALFQNCRGISNTTAVGYYTMLNNATATVIGSTSTPVKVLGTTTNSSITQKFTHTDNRLTYTGALTRVFDVSAILTVTSSANNEIGIYIAKNGTVVAESETYLTANSGGKFENGAIQCIIELATNDYIEVFIENATAANNATVEFLSVTAQAEI